MEHPRGEHPGGYQLFSKDGHHIFLMVDENRKRPAGRPTAADKSALLDSMVSYAGTYRVEGNKVLIHSRPSAVDEGRLRSTDVLPRAARLSYALV